MSQLIGVRGQGIADPVHCPKCGNRWDFKLDAIGRVIAVHPVTPCIAKPAHAPIVGYCSNDDCGEPVHGDTSKRPGPRQLYWCSDSCHKIIMFRKRLRDAELTHRRKEKERRVLTGIRRRDAA